jgi:hypothetical protein
MAERMRCNGPQITDKRVDGQEVRVIGDSPKPGGGPESGADRGREVLGKSFDTRE